MYSMFLTKCSGDVRVLSLLQRKYDSDGIMTSSIIRPRIILLLQCKTSKIRPESSRAGLSYTVASREFVRQIPNTTAQSCCKFKGHPYTRRKKVYY